MQVDKHQEKQNSYQPMEYKDYQVMAGDELYINVLTFSQETNALLNPAVTTSGDNSLHGLYSYVISQEGEINFPFVGNIQVEGKTIREIKFIIQDKLKSFFSEVSVNVELVNMAFSLLTESKSRRCEMTHEKVTIYQALAMSGDLGEYADRAKVKIIRKEGDNTVVREFDLRKRDVINSEFYYVRPNDVIYVHDFRGQFFRVNKFGSIFSTALNTVSLGTTVWGLVRIFTKVQKK